MADDSITTGGKTIRIPISPETKSQIIRDNLAALGRDIKERSLVWNSHPALIDLSTNNLCNLRCAMCSPKIRQKAETMSDTDVVIICEQVLPTANVLTPTVGGEPLLGNIDLISEQCLKYGVLLNVITNGTLLTAETYKKIRNNLKVLHISFDSHIREVYETIRVGADFGQVARNIRDVCAEAKGDDNEICISAVVMAGNVRRLPEYIDFVADMGADSVELQRMHYIVEGAAALDAFGNIDDAEIYALHTRAIERAEERGLNVYSYIDGFNIFVNNPRKAGKYDDFEIFQAAGSVAPSCYMMTHYMRINPDGNVLPCCVSEFPTIMGNIKEQGLEDIWNGNAYRNLRREMFEKRYNPICEKCAYRTRLMNSETKKTMQGYYEKILPYRRSAGNGPKR